MCNYFMIPSYCTSRIIYSVSLHMLNSYLVEAVLRLEVEKIDFIRGYRCIYIFRI